MDLLKLPEPILLIIVEFSNNTKDIIYSCKKFRSNIEFYKNLLFTCDNQSQLNNYIFYLKWNSEELFNSSLVPNLISLELIKDEFNLPIDNLPSGLISLKTSRHFDQSVDNLPSKLKYLELNSKYFNQSVDNLPSKLKYLELSSHFNQKVNLLPSELLTLKINKDNRNYGVTGPAPLNFPSYFNQNIDQLPSSLLNITIGGRFNQPINKLPEKLTNLSLFSYNFQQRLTTFPPNLNSITLNKNYNQNLDHIPSHIKITKI